MIIQIDGGIYIDLHNDYDCHSISFVGVSKELYLGFEFCEDKERKVDLLFKEVEIIKVSFNLVNLGDVKTIDSLYRGMYDLELLPFSGDRFKNNRVPIILQKQDYNPFGKTKAIVTGGINRYLYNGKEIQS